MATAKKAAKKLRRGILFALVPSFFSFIDDYLPAWCTYCINVVGGVWDDFFSFLNRS